MVYLPEASLPQPDTDDALFWQSCTECVLRFQRCAECGKVRHPPGPTCPHCRSFRSEWIEAPPVGEVFTFTVVHHAAHPSVKGALPYNVVVVDYPELGHIRLISNLVDVPANEIQIGMKVRLIWEHQNDECWVPRYVRA